MGQDEERRDVIAYRQARARAEASQLVADERLFGAASSMRLADLSLRDIEERTGASKNTIARVFLKAGKFDDRRWALDRDEYWSAHNAAWRHHPGAQSLAGDEHVPPLDSPEGRGRLQAAGLDGPVAMALAEQLAREVLAVVHPEVKVTPGRLMVAMVQVARDPEAAYVLAGYDPIPEDPERQAVIRTSRARAAYARADWIDAEGYDSETGTTLAVD